MRCSALPTARKIAPDATIKIREYSQTVKARTSQCEFVPFAVRNRCVSQTCNYFSLFTVAPLAPKNRAPIETTLRYGFDYAQQLAQMKTALLLSAVHLGTASQDKIFQLSLQRKILPLKANSLTRHRALQDEAPIYGDFRRLAYFFADVYVGTPAQKFTVITDTGSSLMAVPCFDCADCGSHMNPKYQPSQSSTSRAVSCSSGCPQGTSCGSSQQCSYIQSYAEGSSIRGVIYQDQVYIGTDGGVGTVAESSYAIPFKFGCQQHEGGLFTTQEADGIMGLGQGEMSMMKNMWASGKLQKNMFSVCLNFNGGSMTMGTMDTRLHNRPEQPLRWAKMELTGFYVVRVEGFAVEDINSIASSDWNSPHTILDSGTTFTYIPSGSFRRMSDVIRDWCNGQTGRCAGQRASVSGESMCYRLSSPSDIRTFPSAAIALRPSTGSEPVILTIEPQHLFVNMGWDNGAYCLAVYDNGARGAVIGANAMMGNDVIFDMAGDEGSGPRAGFAGSDCVLPEAGVSPSPSSGPASASPSPTPSTTPSQEAPSASPTPTSTPSTSSTGSLPSGTPSTVPEAGVPSASPSAAASEPTGAAKPSEGRHNASGTDGEEAPNNNGGLSYLGLNPSQQSILAAGIVGSAVLACTLLYCCTNCEMSCGRITIRLGKGKGAQGSYTPVQEAEEEEEEEEGEDWGDGGPPATDSARPARPTGTGAAKAKGAPKQGSRGGPGAAGSAAGTSTAAVEPRSDDFQIEVDDEDEEVDLPAPQVQSKRTPSKGSTGTGGTEARRGAEVELKGVTVTKL